MAERELGILVRAKGALQAAKDIGKVDSSIGRLSRLGGKALTNLTQNLTRIGLAVGVGIAGAVAMGVRSLADLARTEAQTAAVIASTGGAAGQTTKSIRGLSEELEKLSTVDDKVIQDGANMLLTFTNIGAKVFPDATKAALNMAVAMAGGNVEQVDLKASAIQLGKALNDPTKGMTALRKVGVAFTKEQEKQIKALQKSGDIFGAQTIILKELEVEFGNAAKAAGTGPEATWRRLQDVGEDLSQSIARGVLPVLERMGKWLSTKLADPAVIAAIEELGQGLGRAASDAMDFIETIDFKAIGDGLSVAAGAAGTIVSAFMSMPDWVKIAVVSGWGLNKLTGGALGGIVGELGKGLIKGVLGMNAGVVNINAGVVNGAGGGLPAVAGAAGAGVGGAALAGAGILAASAAISAAAILASPQFNRSQQLKGQAANLTAAEIAAIKYYESDAAYQRQVVLHLGKAPTKADYESGQAKLRNAVTGSEMLGPPKPGKGVAGTEMFGPPKPVFEDDPRLAAIIARAEKAGRQPKDLYGAAMATLQRNIARDQAKAAAAAELTNAGIDAAKAAAMSSALSAHTQRENDTNRIVAAIKGLSIPATRVTISAADNIKTSVQRRRIVKPAGSRGSFVEEFG